MISIVKKRRIWFTFSSILMIASIVLLFVYGLRFGIDFTGGSLLEVEFDITRPTNQQITDALTPLELGSVVVQPVGDTGAVLRFGPVDEAKHQQILSTLIEAFNPLKEPLQMEGATITLEAQVLSEKRFESVGPVIGQELKRKAVWAIILVCLSIIAYVAFAFRKVSKPISSWSYGFFAVAALIHDIVITIGVFVLLGKFYGVEANAPFVAALLTILGYSVNDTIVTFDRIRENLLRHTGENFEDTVDKSINEVMVRTINTSFTVLLTLFAILLFGGATIRDFVLALIIGVIAGSYSSIFLASQMLVSFHLIMSKRKSA